jgi:Cys-tRNA(Pro)/Cys-tRNA(Cys) deacylase
VAAAIVTIRVACLFASTTNAGAPDGQQCLAHSAVLTAPAYRAFAGHANAANTARRRLNLRAGAPALSSLPMAGQGGTRATELLARRGITHTVHRYTHDPRHPSYGQEASEALAVPPGRVFKTLVADADGTLTVAVVPVAGSLDLKALATAVGAKKAAMADPAAAERATGYVTGGITSIGLRKRLPVVIDSSALNYDTVFCSAGQRGLEIELAPADLVAAAGARVAPIARGQ